MQKVLLFDTIFDVFKVKSVFFYVRFDGNGTIGGSRPSDKRGAGHPDPEIWRKGSLSGGGGGGRTPGPHPWIRHWKPMTIIA